MKTYSIILKVRRPKDNITPSPLQVYFNYNRLFKPFAVGESVLPKYIIKDECRISNSCPNYENINEKVNKIVTRLHRILGNLAMGIEPTIDYVAAQYILELEREKKEPILVRRKSFASYVLATGIDNSIQKIDTETAQLLQRKIALEKEFEGLQADTTILPQFLFKPQQLRDAETDITIMSEYFAKFLHSQTSSDMPVGNERLKHYKSWFNIFVTKFLPSKVYKDGKKKHGFSFTPEGMTLEMYYAYQKFGIETMGWRDSTFGAQVNIWKTFLNYVDSTITPVNSQVRSKLFKKLKEKKDVVIILNQKDLDMIYNYRNLSSTPTDIQRVLDLCLFGNYTGLRISEILGNQFVIQVHNEEEYIQGITFKNDSNISIPVFLAPIAKEVLLRYKKEGSSYYTLDLMTDVHFNHHIKKALKLVFEHFDHSYTKEKIKMYKTVKGIKTLDVEGYFYDIYSSHWNRRSCITRWFQNGIERDDILIMVGSRDIEILNDYIANDPRSRAKRLSHLKQKPV